jgi:hypothetical protein
MPIIPLTPQDDGWVTIANSSGSPVYLPQRRIRGWVRLATQVAAQQAIIDTGAPACFLSKSIWSRLHAQNQVTWVSHSPGLTSVGSLPNTNFLGRRTPYRPGRVVFKPVDIHCRGRELSPRAVLTICLEDEPNPVQHRIIIGLVEVLDGRTLQIQVSEDGQRWVALMAEP